MASKELQDLLNQIKSGGGRAVEDEDDPPVAQFTLAPVGFAEGRKQVSEKSYQLTQKPLSKAIADFDTLDRTELIRFQELAFQAGLYGGSTEREDIPFGSYDDDTFKIWANLNKSAARAGQAGKKHTIWDRLQDLVEHRPAGLGKKEKAKRAPLVVELPDPRELEEIVRGIAPNVIGRDADPEFTKDFIAMYTHFMSEFQEQKYALAATEKGGTITAPPSAAALARFRLRTERPEEYEQQRSAERAQEYTALLKSAL